MPNVTSFSSSFSFILSISLASSASKELCDSLSFYSQFAATEIRCQEKSKGGLCYEVILAQPTVVVNPPKANTNAPIAKSVSAEEIERKLREAEERRIVSLNFAFNSQIDDIYSTPSPPHFPPLVRSES